MVRSCLVLLILVGSLGARTPEAAIVGALADARRISPLQQPRVRYLTLYHLPAKEQEQWERVLAFWANSLSSEAKLVPPSRVAAGLWRVNLDDYSWKLATWEKLLDVEPYFHLKTLAVVVETVTDVEEYGNFYDGFGSGKVIAITKEEAAKRSDVVWRTTRRQPVQKKVNQTKEIVALNPLIAQAEHKALVSLTSSEVPIVRADWWLWQTAVAKDRKAGYYEWLNLGKKEADFQALVGADVKAAQRVKREVAAVVGRSIVTLNNRGLERFQTITGSYWRSRDYADNKDAKNVLRLLDGDAKHDATEQYGTLPNGLFAYWLGDANGARQDAAPDFIASDSQSRGTDRRVHIGLSCVRCHVEGIRPIDDWARRIYQPPFILEAAEYEKQKRLRQLYLSDLGKLVKRDQSDYAEALKQVNDLTPAANAKAFADAWYDYTERDRTLNDLAAEVGIKPEDLAERLRVLARGQKKLDPILAAVVQGFPIRVEHVEEIYPELLRIAR